MRRISRTESGTDSGASSSWYSDKTKAICSRTMLMNSDSSSIELLNFQKPGPRVTLLKSRFKIVGLWSKDAVNGAETPTSWTKEASPVSTMK